MVNESNRRNFNCVNIIKFILSILVIAAHTTEIKNISSSVTISNMFYFIVQVCVPFFFISMGFSLAEKVNFFEFKRMDIIKIAYVLKGMIKQYVIWSLIYLPLALIDYIKNGYSFIYSLLLYLKGFFLKGEHYNSWPLWYLLSFIYVLSFIYFCLKKGFKFKKVIISCFAIGSLSFLIRYLDLYSVNSSFTFINYLLKFLEITIDNGRIFTGFLYVPLGIIVQKKSLNYKYCIGTLFLSYILAIIFRFKVNEICVIFFSLSLFVIALNIKLPQSDTSICNYLRDLSTSNYYLHMWVYTIYYYLIYKAPVKSADCFVYTAIFTNLIGILYLIIKNKPYRKES